MIENGALDRDRDRLFDRHGGATFRTGGEHPVAARIIELTEN
jgi:hypothetical protein